MQVARLWDWGMMQIEMVANSSVLYRLTVEESANR